MFKTIKNDSTAEIIEKKSKFISNIFYVEDALEAEKKIEEIKKKYHDARHNTYAYRVLNENGVLERQSDDGEPAGTAGSPILGILQKRKLCNVLVVVTRYFGGILLGTGGLVKAYSEATSLAVEKAEEIAKEQGYLVEIIIDYQKQGEFEYICEKNGINIISKEYTDKIKNLIEISEEKLEKIFKNYFQNIPILIKENKYINII